MNTRKAGVCGGVCLCVTVAPVIPGEAVEEHYGRCTEKTKGSYKAQLRESLHSSAFANSLSKVDKQVKNSGSS
jgi:hypothetical protein